jgi:hypothetical protein
LTSDDLDRLELSPSERKILSTGIFGPGAVAVSNDVTYFQNQVRFVVVVLLMADFFFFCLQILGHGATSNVYSGLSLTFGKLFFVKKEEEKL